VGASASTDSAATEPASVHGYYEVLRSMHRYARPRTYLEIGARRGESIGLAASSTRVIGIDPAPRIERPLPKRWKVYAETSDAYFARPDVASLTGTVDVAFIDGLHLYDQVLRDIVNVEPFMNPDGVVILHDCLPPDEKFTSRTFEGGFWTGDVWKVIPILREHRPDLDVAVAPMLPTGLAFVTGFGAGNRVLDDGFDEIVAAYADIPYATVAASRPGTWAGVRDLFPEFRRRNLRDELQWKSQTWSRLVDRWRGRPPAPAVEMVP